MITFTDYLFFTTRKRQEFIRITDEVAAIVQKSGVTDGMVLVSAMHITAGVYVNDWENGLIEDFQVWLERPSEAHDHGAPGDAADYGGQARSGSVGAGLLRGI
jgi:thiamine phosphate synthase YjbQ (UPF0047 family)